MMEVNLFLLLPETEPANGWMRSTEAEFYEIDAYEKIIHELNTIFESMEIEKYEGFYDSLNIMNFLFLYDTLEDCYPTSASLP